MNEYHEHPLEILRYSAKNIWLLIFPILRSLSHFPFRIDREWVYEWLKGAWFDLLILVFILVFGFVRWHCSVIRIGDKGVTHMEGVIFRVNKTIPYCNISSSSFEYPFYLKPFNAVRVRCDTSAGLFSRSDMKITLNTNTSRELKDHLPGIMDIGNAKKFPKPSAVSLILFSIFFSSGTTGVIYIATLFFKGGDIARDMISKYLDSITAGTEKYTGKLLQYLPNAVAGLGALFIGAWLTSFTVNLLKYAKFSLSYDKKYIKLSYGALTEKEYSITAKHINYIDFHQNLVMKMIRAAATHISCAGYGNSRKSIPVLVPVRRVSRMGNEFDKIGINRGNGIEYRPQLRGLWQYIWQPVIVTVSLIPAYLIVSRIIPMLNRLTIFVAIMAEIPAIWMIAVKTVAFFTSGVALYDDRIKVRYCRFTTFHTVIADRRKLVKVEYEQTIIQKMKGRCNMIFWFEGEVARRHKVKALPTSDIVTISGLLDIDINKRE